MTYKAIVKNMIEIKAGNWVEKLLKENNIEYKWTEEEVTKLENDKESNTILYTCTVTITLEAYNKVVVLVGGTADDMCGICTSVIWDENHDNIIWMSVEETRKALGIKEFKLFDDPAQDEAEEEFGFTDRERTEKHTFLVQYENVVTDDLIEEVLEDMTLEEADNIAQEHSRRNGLSAGNFDMYVYAETDDLEGWVDVFDFYGDDTTMTDEDVSRHMLEVADKLFGKDNSIRERLERIERDKVRKAVCDLAAAGTHNYNDILTIVSEWNCASNKTIEVYEITNDADDVVGFGIEDDTFYFSGQAQ